MHRRNGDAPYAGTLDAVAQWSETATVVLARWTGEGVAVAAPHGLDNLLGLVLRPTPRFAADPAGRLPKTSVLPPSVMRGLDPRISDAVGDGRVEPGHNVESAMGVFQQPAGRAVFAARCAAKAWQRRWPLLRVMKG